MKSIRRSVTSRSNTMSLFSAIQSEEAVTATKAIHVGESLGKICCTIGSFEKPKFLNRT
jgi:hypothetical protein